MTKLHITQVSVTPAVGRLIDEGLNLAPYVTRHLNGDWGDINDSERKRNIESLVNNTGHIFSVYQVAPGITVWISTREGMTIIMLPLA